MNNYDNINARLKRLTGQGIAQLKPSIESGESTIEDTYEYQVVEQVDESEGVDDYTVDDDTVDTDDIGEAFDIEGIDTIDDTDAAIVDELEEGITPDYVADEVELGKLAVDVESRHARLTRLSNIIPGMWVQNGNIAREVMRIDKGIENRLAKVPEDRRTLPMVMAAVEAEIKRMGKMLPVTNSGLISPVIPLLKVVYYWVRKQYNDTPRKLNKAIESSRKYRTSKFKLSPDDVVVPTPSIVSALQDLVDAKSLDKLKTSRVTVRDISTMFVESTLKGVSNPYVMALSDDKVFNNLLTTLTNTYDVFTKDYKRIIDHYDKSLKVRKKLLSGDMSVKPNFNYLLAHPWMDEFNVAVETLEKEINSVKAGNFKGITIEQVEKRGLDAIPVMNQAYTVITKNVAEGANQYNEAIKQYNEKLIKKSGDDSNIVILGDEMQRYIDNMAKLAKLSESLYDCANVLLATITNHDKQLRAMKSVDTVTEPDDDDLDA